MSDRPSWTCPGLDRLAAFARRYVPEPAQSEMLLLIEEQRRANILLRALAAERSPKGAEVARVEERIAELVARLEGS